MVCYIVIQEGRRIMITYDNIYKGKMVYIDEYNNIGVGVVTDFNKNRFWYQNDKGIEFEADYTHNVCYSSMSEASYVVKSGR